MARLLDIEIENWAKFNPRSDRANYSWFRLDNTFFHDQSVFGLSSQDKLSYVFVLCELSKKNISRISLDIEYASALLKITPDEFCASLKHLEFSKLIRCHDDGKKTARRRHSASLLPATRRDETDVTRRDERDDTIRPTAVGPVVKSLPELAQIWNEESGSLPKVIACNGNSMRRKKAELRWHENPDRAYWRDVITRIKESDFLMGKSKTSTWRASFDWLVQPDSAAKVLEGKYQNREGSSSDINWENVFGRDGTTK